MLLIFRIEGTVISLVEWTRFQFCGVLENQFFHVLVEEVVNLLLCIGFQ